MITLNPRGLKTSVRDLCVDRAFVHRILVFLYRVVLSPQKPAPHECPTGPVLEVLGLAIWHERRLVWTFGGVGNHFYYGVEGLQSTEICTINLTFACAPPDLLEEDGLAHPMVDVGPPEALLVVCSLTRWPVPWPFASSMRWRLERMMPKPLPEADAP